VDLGGPARVRAGRFLALRYPHIRAWPFLAHVCLFFWENTFVVRIFSEVIDGNLWAIVANTEPSLVLARFLANHADELGAEDIEKEDG
jgi:hypothetical protein